MAVKKSLVWALPEQAAAAASGPPGEADGLTDGDAVSVGGSLDGLDGLGGTDGVSVGGSLGETSTVGLAETIAVASVAAGSVGANVGVDVAPQAARPTARRKRTSGRRTFVTPARTRSTG